MAHNITTNITKHEYDFIDPNSGDKLTREQFIQRHSSTGLGGLKLNVVEETGETETGEIKEL